MKATVGRKIPQSPAELRKAGGEIARRELLEARIAVGLTQEEAAQELGVSADTIHRQETGLVRVDGGLVFALRELTQLKRTGT